jgi:hypothetical protein
MPITPLERDDASNDREYERYNVPEGDAGTIGWELCGLALQHGFEVLRIAVPFPLYQQESRLLQ